MPPCFSRPICSFAMMLNDQASDDQRQRLLPFVTRLACADAPEVERERDKYISDKTGMLLPFERGLGILEGALAIGRQADPLGLGDVRSRMESVQNGSGTTKESWFKWVAALVP